MRLLVAENDPALGTFLCRGLDAEHYAVDLAADGEEAERLADERDYDLLIQRPDLFRWGFQASNSSPLL